MKFFKLEQGKSELLLPFPEIFEFGYEKYDKVHLGSLKPHINPGIEICFIKEGKYNWVINGQPYILFPKNASITLPWENHGSKEGFLDIGIIFWIIIIPKKITINGDLVLSKISSYDKILTREIGKILVSKKHPIVQDGVMTGKLFEELAIEIFNKPFGYMNRVYHILYDMLLSIARKQLNENHFKQDIIFDLEKLDFALYKDIDYDWTVEEMAQIIGKGTTSFTNLLKKKTGFTPLNYLIQLRITEAKKLLIDGNTKITDIAWICGFSSSQHFSNTFKLKTGLSPSDFLKNHCNRVVSHF